MTEQEYEKLVRAVSNKYMADVFPCNPVAPASFEAGNKWTRENPPPEVQALVDVTRQLSECRPDKQQCEMFTLRDAARDAIARFKERSKG